eukprot:6133389-Pyramimonas_sp.AAC.1
MPTRAGARRAAFVVGVRGAPVKVGAVRIDARFVVVGGARPLVGSLLSLQEASHIARTHRTFRVAAGK